MIGSLRGVLIDRTVDGQLLVEVGGVGYRAVVPAGSVAALGELGTPVFLHVHTHVREDAIVLYGFAERGERAAFEVLIATHGVGPALALSVLSAMSPVSLRRAVATDDLDAFTAVPGVGKKTAARLVLELKAKLGDVDDDLALSIVGSGSRRADPTPRSEVRAALAGLGYGVDEVRDVVSSLPDEGAVEELLRLALRQLAATR
ncbi:MAG TPA: Holliday junction branch migration protein RuvA [Acidimicrobiales bacterium]|nr:Holliday junction branch migration protein RuvA [Acidimicrobiales bacterium]